MSTPSDQFDPYAYAGGNSQTPPFNPYAYASGEDAKKPKEDEKEQPSWVNQNLVSPLVRAGAKAAFALPGMAADMGVASRNIIGDAYNKAVGNPATPDYELPTTSFNKLLDEYTVAPATKTGKAAELLNTMAAGAFLPTPAVASAVPSNFAASGTQESGLTGAQQSAMQAGKKLGMKMTPGEQTGSTVLQQAEAKASSVPWLSAPFAAVGRNNQNVLNATAAAGIGESGSSADSNVLGRAADRMGDIFDKAGNPNNIVMVDPKTTTTVLDAIDADKAGLLPGSGSVRDNKLVQNLENLAQNGSMSGEQLAQISSKMGKAAYKQQTSQMGDRDLGDALYDVKSHVDDLLQSSMPRADQAEFADARAQYHTLMQLAKPGVVNPSTGDVSGATLANVLQRGDRSGYLFGRNDSDLYNAARFAQAFKPIVGNSGTATRSADLKDMALAVPGNIASWAYLRPLAPAVRALVNAPGGVQKALNQGISPRMLSTIMTGTAAAGQPVDNNPNIGK